MPNSTLLHHSDPVTLPLPSTLNFAFIPLTSAITNIDTFTHTCLGTMHPQYVFKQLWTSMTDKFTPWQIIVLGSFILQVLIYFGLSLPGLLFPHLKFMHKYKIQQNRSITFADQWKCIKKVAMSKIFIYLPLAYYGYKALNYYHIYLPYRYDEMEPWYVLLPKLYVSLLIEDAWHYFNHRALHTKRLYWIHKMHHNFTAPFPLAAEYAHPIETAVLGIGFFIPVLLFMNHIWFFWTWLFVRMFETIEVHSGYDVPLFNKLNLLHLLPFYGGVQFHDYHHKTFTNNYASTFTFWDKIFGTGAKYFEEQKIKKAKTMKKLE